MWQLAFPRGCDLGYLSGQLSAFVILVPAVFCCCTGVIQAYDKGIQTPLEREECVGWICATLITLALPSQG